MGLRHNGVPVKDGQGLQELRGVLLLVAVPQGTHNTLGRILVIHVIIVS